jgi:hypothetical protein
MKDEVNEADALDVLISAQWESEPDRQAVRRKLSLCGIRSVATLGKCIVTPVSGKRILSGAV